MPLTRMATFADVIERWFAAGCPNVSPTRTSRHSREKSPNTIANARQLLGTDALYREAGYIALSRGREANTLYTVGDRGVDEDLAHAPTREGPEGPDFVLDGLSREGSKRLAIDTPDVDRGDQDHDARVQRVLAMLDALKQPGRDGPERGIGLGL